ncbi:MAG: flavodoxin-dependent (E)-4-hydroxy-3-methylbut-2-enyl-diphosphate synthase [Ruminococcaceae bacterium]|nr:flavodoxin-dependent (E)-4-hydroxy-3-methylbut-2-enyl-diphosphate synthase [Oscillospiraceae bacterium]
MNYREIRRASRAVMAGGVGIGGTHPIAIQSMTNTDPHDARATAAQMMRLQDAGCDVVRITVPDLEAAETIGAIRQAGVSMPVVADIHFDYRVALRCAELGFDKIRINPGNIGDEDRVRQVANACRERRIPIRIGVNSGSLEKHLLAKYGSPTAQALCESALYHSALLEKFGFEDIVISIKASDVQTMVAANRLLSQSCPYPIHLGVTEAGGGEEGMIKSAMGIGALLLDGIGDTLRVSLTEDPVHEIAAARRILNGLQIEGQSGMNIVSCPTCGRTQIDLISLCESFKQAVRAEGLDRLPIKVALMGCVVNGPGEAREADIGIAGGRGEGLLFRHGQIIEKVPEGELIPRLLAEIRAMDKQ